MVEVDRSSLERRRARGRRCWPSPSASLDGCPTPRSRAMSDEIDQALSFLEEEPKRDLRAVSQKGSNALGSAVAGGAIVLATASGIFCIAYSKGLIVTPRP